MRAAVLVPGRTAPEPFLQIEEVPRPEPQPGYVVLRVLACGVCRSSFPVTRLWAKWPVVPLQSCRWEAGPGSHGSAAWMGVAGTATTAWRISATNLRLRDTQ